MPKLRDVLKPEAELVRLAQQQLDEADAKKFRSIQGSFTTWAKRNKIADAALGAGHGHERRDQIVLYLAWQQQKKQSNKTTTVAKEEGYSKRHHNRVTPMSIEVMDRKVGVEKGKGWRAQQTESGEWALARQADPVTGSMEDPYVTYLVPQYWLEEIDGEKHTKVVKGEVEGHEEEDKVVIRKASDKVNVEIKQEQLSPEEQQRADLREWCTPENLETVVRRHSQFVSDVKMLIPKAQGNNYAVKWAQDLEAFAKRVPKSQSVISRLLADPYSLQEGKYDEKQIGILKEKVAQLDDEHTTLMSWASAFGCSTPTAAAAAKKRSRKRKDAGC